MTEIQNSKPVYDPKERTYHIGNNQMTSFLVPTFWSLIIGI